MKRIFIFIIFIGLVFRIEAQQQITINEAMASARSYFGEDASRGENGISIGRVFVDINEHGDTILYQVFNQDSGYVLLAGSRACTPLLSKGHGDIASSLWSDSSSIPGGLWDLLTWYRRQINYCFQNDTVTLAYANEWNMLCNNIVPSVPAERELEPYVLPLLTSTWGQTFSNDVMDLNAYNYYADTGNCVNGNHCPVGCVAVALGQVMNYWKHPQFMFQMPYQFDWCNITDNLRTSSPNYFEERKAIAYLLRKCADSVITLFCHKSYIPDCEQSSADMENNLVQALMSFYYKEASYSEKYLIEELWLRRIKNEISNGRPVIYSSSGEQGCHCYVCDGYNTDGLFHINWGHYGWYDGYFSLNNLNPNNILFNDNHAAIFKIEPENITSSFYCDFPLNIESFYTLFYNNNHNSGWHPYQIVPNNTTDLISVPENYPDSLRTIPTGAYSVYEAHQSITLVPGFHAEWGSDFTARITPCSLCDETRMLEIGTLTEENATDTVGTEENSERMLLHHSDSTYLIEPSQVRLYPNPTTGKLTVEGLSGATNIQIYDVKGMSVFRWYVESRSGEGFVLNVSALRQGTYIVRILTKENKVLIGRFVKE